MTSTTPTYTSRPATLADKPTLRRLHLAMLAELVQYDHDIPPTSINVEVFWRTLFEPALLSGVHAILLAEADGEAVAALWIVPEHTGVLEAISKRAIDWGCYVHPSHRRRGIATTLRSEAIHRLATHNFTSIISQVSLLNKAGLLSYTRAGALPVGQIMEIQL